jgi:hypothetical protein
MYQFSFLIKSRPFSGPDTTKLFSSEYTKPNAEYTKPKKGRKLNEYDLYEFLLLFNTRG